jgi:predicted porin
MSYTIAEADMDSPHFSPVTVTLNGGTLEAAYNSIYMENADDYSDLDYQAFELELEATYQLLNNLSVTLNYWYSDFDDDEKYVYGDLDGDAYIFTGFLTYHF